MEKNCGSCGGCGGGCKGCGGCGSSLELSREEIAVLQVLGQVAFLPVARRVDTMDAVCLEPEMQGVENVSLTLALLEKKQLIDLDYRKALAGFDYGAYCAYPCKGSAALTARGQQVLEIMNLQGIGE